MKRYNFIITLMLIALAAPLSAATAIENATAYTQAARVSLDSGFAETAAGYADTALIYCESSADAWYLKALAEYRINPLRPVSETVEILEHVFAGGAFWVNESQFDARMWLADMCLKTGKYARAAEVLTEDPAITEEKLLLLTEVWYAAGNREEGRVCVETGIQMYPSDSSFYILYFKNENPDEVMGTELCSRLTGNVGLFDPYGSDIYLYASKFVDADTASRYIMMYGQYRGINPLYPLYALEKGFISFEQALYEFDALCHDDMDYGQFEKLCSLASEEDLDCLYAFLDTFTGTLLFRTDETGLADMSVTYLYGRPYSIYYDKDLDGNVELLVTCDYGTPVFVYLPAQKASLAYNRYPSVTHVRFEEPEITLEFARNACTWKAVSMEKASFSTDDFAFYVPELADPVENVTPLTFVAGCSIIECTTDDPAGCTIRIVMNGGKPVDAFYMVRGKLYAHSYFRNGELLYRDVDMDGDGLYELSEQYLYDAAEPDAELIGNRIYGTVAGCFTCPRFSALLSDSDGDGFYEYEETIAPDGTSEKVWY